MKLWTNIERNTCNLVRISNRKINVFRDAANNSDEHEVAKLLVFRELRAMGHNLIVEAIFVGGGRADILDLTDGTAIEIGHTEEKKDFMGKDYPVDKVFLKASDVLRRLK